MARHPVGSLANKEYSTTVPVNSGTEFLTTYECSRGTEDQGKDCRIGQLNIRRSLHPIRTSLWRRHHVSDLPNIADAAPTFVATLNGKTTTFGPNHEPESEGCSIEGPGGSDDRLLWTWGRVSLRPRNRLQLERLNRRRPQRSPEPKI